MSPCLPKSWCRHCRRGTCSSTAAMAARSSTCHSPGSDNCPGAPHPSSWDAPQAVSGSRATMRPLAPSKHTCKQVGIWQPSRIGAQSYLHRTLLALTSGSIWRSKAQNTDIIGAVIEHRMRLQAPWSSFDDVRQGHVHKLASRTDHFWGRVHFQFRPDLFVKQEGTLLLVCKHNLRPWRNKASIAPSACAGLFEPIWPNSDMMSRVKGNFLRRVSDSCGESLGCDRQGH